MDLMDLTVLSNLAVGVVVLVTYTVLIRQVMLQAKKIEDFEKWRDAVDPPQQRHRRRDSDVLRMIPRDSQGA